MKIPKTLIYFTLTCVFFTCLTNVHAQEKPNIVLVFLDNFGWGEPGFNGGGIIRGAPTPRMDTLAEEGLRLTNFNVEVSVTRSFTRWIYSRHLPGSSAARFPRIV